MSVKPFCIDDGKMFFDGAHLVASTEYSRGNHLSIGSDATFYGTPDGYYEKFKDRQVTRDMIGYEVHEIAHIGKTPEEDRDSLKIFSIEVIAYGLTVSLPVTLSIDKNDTDNILRNKLYIKLSKVLHSINRGSRTLKYDMDNW